MPSPRSGSAAGWHTGSERCKGGTSQRSSEGLWRRPASSVRDWGWEVADGVGGSAAGMGQVATGRVGAEADMAWLYKLVV